MRSEETRTCFEKPGRRPPHPHPTPAHPHTHSTAFGDIRKFLHAPIQFVYERRPSLECPFLAHQIRSNIGFVLNLVSDMTGTDAVVDKWLDDERSWLYILADIE